MADYPDELWRSVADLSGMLLSEENQETTLRRVSDLAVRSIASPDRRGVDAELYLFGGGALVRAANARDATMDLDTAISSTTARS